MSNLSSAEGTKIFEFCSLCFKVTDLTIATPEVEADLSTPVANQIGVPIVIEV
jgi:hypothetical protein